MAGFIEHNAILRDKDTPLRQRLESHAWLLTNYQNKADPEIMLITLLGAIADLCKAVAKMDIDEEWI